MSQKVIVIQKIRGPGASTGKRTTSVFESEFKKNKHGRYNDWAEISTIQVMDEKIVEIPIGSPEPEPIIITDESDTTDDEPIDLGYSVGELKKLKKDDLGEILSGMDVEFDLVIKKDELIKLIIDKQ